MVAIGMTLIALTLLASFLWWKGNLFEQRWLLQIFAWSVLLPQLANQLGWYSAEVGRQPWVVYGLLRTSDALSQSLKASQVYFHWYCSPWYIFFCLACLCICLIKKSNMV
jgi:cytochrome d ubiquinol oxidase subunit I